MKGNISDIMSYCTRIVEQFADDKGRLINHMVHREQEIAVKEGEIQNCKYKINELLEELKPTEKQLSKEKLLKEMVEKRLYELFYNRFSANELSKILKLSKTQKKILKLLQESKQDCYRGGFSMYDFFFKIDKITKEKRQELLSMQIAIDKASKILRRFNY